MLRTWNGTKKHKFGPKRVAQHGAPIFWISIMGCNGLLPIVVMIRHTDTHKRSRTITQDATEDMNRIWTKSTNEHEPLITSC